MKVLTYCGWLINLPFLLLWSLFGTLILFQKGCSLECFPGDKMHVLFVLVWLALSYAWMGMHLRLAILAVRMEVHLRKTEAELHAVATNNADVVARWGQVRALEFTYTEDSSQLKGLSSQDIASLPSSTVHMTPDDDEVCSI